MIDAPVTKEFFSDLTILCVEDEDWVRSSLGEFLGRRFAEVYTAENGEEGLRMFEEVKPDIVLTDIRMPVMDGLEMATKIKVIDPDLPVIVSSSFSDPEYLLEAINLGIESYVLKPVESQLLTKTLYRAATRVKYKRALKTLKENEELFRILTENLPTGVCLYKENFLYVNEAMSKITGYSRKDLLKMKTDDLTPTIKQEISHASKRRLKGEEFVMRYEEVPIINKNNEDKFVHIVASTVTFRDESVGIANITDVTERRWYETQLEENKIELEKLNQELKENLLLIEYKNRQLETQLYTDKLTSLPNRVRLLEDLKTSTHPVLILLNLDSFKEINDFYGVDIGDYVLDEVAKRITQYTETTPFELYKLQADEYALFCDQGMEHEYIFKTISGIYEHMDRNLVTINNQEVHVGISAGISIEEKDTVLSRADVALKSAKKQRRPFVFYNETMKVMKEYEQNIRWVGILKEAMDKERIVPFFQPIMDNQTYEITRYECLARLVTEEGSIYSPYYFLDISKRSRLYHRITTAIISRSFAVFAQHGGNFSINISLEDILDPNTTRFIKEHLMQYRAIAPQVTFEILESEGIENYELVASFIGEVKELGCKVAIDDFGSGYSNFAHLLKLNVDYIKIDASIIKNSHIDHNSQVVSRTIVDFARQLEIKTVAEYVHSKEVLEAVKNLGVDYSQGFYIGEPKAELLEDRYFQEV